LPYFARSCYQIAIDDHTILHANKVYESLAKGTSLAIGLPCLVIISGMRLRLTSSINFKQLVLNSPAPILITSHIKRARSRAKYYLRKPTLYKDLASMLKHTSGCKEVWVMHFTLDMAFFGFFAILMFAIVVIHRAHGMTALYKKGNVTANYWGTYGAEVKSEQQKRKQKSYFPKIAKDGTLSLPAASNQNTTCIAGKVAPQGK